VTESMERMHPMCCYLEGHEGEQHLLATFPSVVFPALLAGIQYSNVALGTGPKAKQVHAIVWPCA
jgi:hypothetical protein